MTFLLALTLTLRFAAVAAPVTGTPPATDSRTFVGQIVQVDAVNRTVVVTDSMKTTKPRGPARKPQLMTISLTGETAVVRGKTPAAFSDLKPRDNVVVRYRLTPAGATALSFRVAEAVKPRPSATPGVPGTSSGAGTTSETVTGTGE